MLSCLSRPGCVLRRSQLSVPRCTERVSLASRLASQASSSALAWPSLRPALRKRQRCVAGARACACQQQPSSAEPALPDRARFAGLPLLRNTFQLLRRHFWTVLVAFLLCDACTWLLHRCSHRITNLLAVNLLSDVSPEAIGNHWWLSNDPTVANFETGYQYFVFGIFLLVFPLNMLFRTLATAVAILCCHQHADSAMPPAAWPSMKGVRSQLGQHWSSVRQRWRQLWEVELLLAVRVIPLSGLCLLLLPLFWTLPRLMSLSATTSLAVLEGAPSGDALTQSTRRLQPVWRSIAWPYLMLVLGAQLLTFLKAAAFGAVPLRLQRDLPELSIVIFAATSLLTFGLYRMRDLLGLAAYQMTADLEKRPLPTKPREVT